MINHPQHLHENGSGFSESLRADVQPSNNVSLDAAAIPQHQQQSEYNGIPPSILNTPTDLDLWDLGLNAHEPSWLLGEDFDIDALNYSIDATISGWGHTNPAPSADQRRMYDAANTLYQINSVPSSSTPGAMVQQNWYTKVASEAPPRRPSQPADQDQVDEAYRTDLSNRLRPRMSDDALPSADFLNLCIKLYFVKFNPIFPLIHAPSFRPSSENALILLSICSMGALFVGSRSAAAQGRKIFQRLNKAILASWETYVGRGGREILSMAQAATIGQTFGLLSGVPGDLFMTETFNGTVIAWARQHGMFRIEDSLKTAGAGEYLSMGELWKRWIEVEEAVRVVMGLIVHDSEFAAIFHHEPILRHDTSKVPRCCSEEIFNASTASQWHTLIGDVHSADQTVSVQDFGHTSMRVMNPYNSNMYAYATLAGITASIQEQKEADLDASSREIFRNRLLSWHKARFRKVSECNEDPLCLNILWHEAFMSLYVDVDLLEQAIGRDGVTPSYNILDRVRLWVSSSEARRCVLHALFIQKHMESQPAGVEPAIHVPKALFYSAIVIYCYIKFTPSIAPFTPSQDDVNIPELQISELASPVCHTGREGARQVKLSPVDSSSLCNVVDLLRRVGHWELSRKFASILENLVNDLANASVGGG